MKDLYKGFTAAAAAIGLTTLSACSPPSETQNPSDGERRLSQSEIALAQEIFGNQINYNRIFIAQGNSRETSTTLGGRINFSKRHYRDDYSQSKNPDALGVYFHELTHIWQEQNGVDLAGSAISLFFKNGGSYKKSYEYRISDLPNFTELGIEQQGEIIEDFVSIRTSLNEANRLTSCASIRIYEDALKPIFPAIQTPQMCRQ